MTTQSIGVGMAVVIVLSGALAGCGTIRKAKQLKALKDDLAMNIEVEEVEAPSLAEPEPPPQKVAAPEESVPALPIDRRLRPDMIALCPIDSDRFDGWMTYCPEHGVRLVHKPRDPQPTAEERPDAPPESDAAAP